MGARRTLSLCLAALAIAPAGCGSPSAGALRARNLTYCERHGGSARTCACVLDRALALGDPLARIARETGRPAAARDERLYAAAVHCAGR